MTIAFSICSKNCLGPHCIDSKVLFSHLLLCNLTSCKICNLPWKVGRSFVVFSKFPLFRTHPPSLGNFTHTVGPIPHYLRARPEIMILTRESRGQGVFLQLGGPPNTFTGATQPIPVGSDGSVQAGPPDVNAGRDTHGVVNKNSTPRCVSPHAMRLRG